LEVYHRQGNEDEGKKYKSEFFRFSGSTKGLTNERGDNNPAHDLDDHPERPTEMEHAEHPEASQHHSNARDSGPHEHRFATLCNRSSDRGESRSDQSDYAKKVDDVEKGV